MKKDRPEWARRLTEARKSSGFSQRKFSKILGINAGTLVKYELGEREPGFKLIRKIVELTGVKTEWLLLGTGSKEKTGDISIFTLYPGIPRDDCDSLVEMLTTMNSSKVYYHRVMMEWAKIKMDIEADLNKTIPLQKASGEG